MKKMRVGIFGGTFNPPHIGHVEAAKAFQVGAKLDKLIIMPAFLPPHKIHDNTVTSIERLEMCKLAFKDLSNTEVSDLEILRGGKSYTYLTLQELTSYDTELYFLCGTDMILTMDTWKNPDIIFSLAEICYIRREKDSETTERIRTKCNDYLKKYGASIIPIDAEVIEISSSEIRSNVDSMSKYLSTAGADYICKAGLYR